MSNKLTTLVNRVNSEEIISKAREATRNVWLCTLGAYSLATKSSVKTIETLVREGRTIQPKARQQIEEKSAELMTTANDTIQRGERLVRERFLRPLDFVLLATRRDVEQLSLRVIELSDEVHRLATGKVKSASKAAKAEDETMLANAA